MRIEFLQHTGVSQLIAIFAGWSTGPSFYSAISHPGWDVMVVHDYSSLDFPLEVLDGYSTIAVFGWSMGVWAASRVLPSEKVTLAVAVNGTEHPRHDSLGIPENIFDGTADTLSPRNLMKFRRRMAADCYNELAEGFGDDDIEALITQLRYVASVDDVNTPFSWHRAYVSVGDMIFPADNQTRAWQLHPSHPEIIPLEGPHYVNLLPIVRTALPDTGKIGLRFSKALSTYNEEASAQIHIAGRLAEMCGDRKAAKIAEIGAGSGLFTRLYAPLLQPEEIDFIDLYELPRFNVASRENYIIGNAEKWIEEEAASGRKGYDAIVSASALQWFVNPDKFFANASQVLKKEGFLACSTFLPGNLEELKGVNPYGLVYRTKEELIKILSRYFSNIHIEEETITLDFSSPRETLLHLSRTGVGGSMTSRLPLNDLLRRLPLRLTYRPLYILAH